MRSGPDGPRMNSWPRSATSCVLRSMRSSAGWPCSRARAGDGDTLARGIEVIERNARAQARIIEDLLDMSAIISGKVRLNVRPVPVAPIVAAALETRPPGRGCEADQDPAGPRRRSCPRGARRPGPAAAGPLEPAQQRGEVHAARRLDPGAVAAGRGQRRGSRERRWRGDRSIVPAVRLRPLPASGLVDDTTAQWPGPRAVHRYQARGTARRVGARRQRRSRLRRDLRPVAAACPDRSGDRRRKHARSGRLVE